MSKTKLTTAVKKEKISTPDNSSTDSLAFKKITDSAQIQFPNQDIYYVYRPAKTNASLLERFAAFLSLIYYKYLLHSGLYVMTKNERRIINAIVMDINKTDLISGFDNENKKFFIIILKIAIPPKHIRQMAKVTNKKSPTESDNLQRLYQQSDLFLPKTRVNYFVYKPARTLPANAPFHQKLLNSLQLVYYKYQLATGLYMMNERERALINFLILASIALTIYHFILK